MIIHTSLLIRVETVLAAYLLSGSQAAGLTLLCWAIFGVIGTVTK